MTRPDKEEFFTTHFARERFLTPQAYQIISKTLLQSLSSDGVISTVIDCLRSCRDHYSPSSLLYVSNIEDFYPVIKPHDSVLDKLYRINCLDNENWPNPPHDAGFVEGISALSFLNDILRGRIVCRYMDAPQRVCEKLKESFGDRCSFFPKNSGRGYYSWHAYIDVSGFIPDGVDVREITFKVEIQFVTQLADALNELTHGVYEELRLGEAQAASNQNWQWDPDNPRFKTTFVGHSIHMIEGILLEMKNSQYEGNS